ncbi:probable rubredoxin [Synechococcus sp. WH 5701]|nr:probable rubredoxin [Synechococcus sp. WH 5701]
MKRPNLGRSLASVGRDRLDRVRSDGSGASAMVNGHDGDEERASDKASNEAPGAPAAVVESDPDSHRYECRSCGFVYDPEEGIRKLSIAPGTPFTELDPIGFRCPVCRSRVGAFRDIGPRSKPSGFEENLNFGLGVNKLTPGQKNVLIFGGFALAFAFFLSLYSLR